MHLGENVAWAITTRSLRAYGAATNNVAGVLCMWKVGGVMLAAAVAGCSSFSSLGETYGAMTAQAVTTKADTWRVFDRPVESKILVQRVAASTAAQAPAALGANPPNAATLQPEYQEAALAFLSQTGRTCKIKDSYLVVAPSWEFAYECDRAPAGSAPKQ